MSHSKLLHKLSAYGMEGRLLGWYEAFLSNRRQVVRVGKEISSEEFVTSGVPQGSVSGPYLFLLYINDVPGVVYRNTGELSIFADDLKIFGNVSENDRKLQFLRELPLYIDAEPLCILEQSVRELGDWANLWQLIIANEKCSVLHIGNRNPHVTYSVCNKEIGSCTEIRDLGITVSCDLKWSKHCQIQASKALRTIGIIFRVFSTKDSSLLTFAYCVYVRPQLEFCTEVWSPSLKKDIECVERVQHHFTYRVFQRCFDNMPCYEDRCLVLGLQSLEMRRLKNDLKMCFKIMTGVVDVSEAKFFQRSTTGLRGHSKKLYKPKCSSNVKKSSFMFRVVEPWNSLPENVVHQKTVESFVLNLCDVDMTKFLTCYRF